MAEKSLAAVKIAASTTELREFDLPEIPPDAALLRVEIAGVCGTDVSQYKLPLRGAPLIMGHENVGYLAKVGRDFERLKGFHEGDLVFLEHYLPCGHCEWDHMGEYRHCAATEWFYDPAAIRYGYTAIDTTPSLWGGFSHYVYLPLNAVLHAVPRGLSPEEAGVATPMSNGIQWTLFDGGVGYGSSVLIQGPGQQGMCCAMAAKQAGASTIIVTGTSKDARRLEVARAMGADAVIDVEKEDARARVLEMTGGRGVDVAVDCTSGGGTAPMLLAIEASKRRAATLVVQGEGNATFPDFPIGRLTRKGITMKSARGHSYRAVELGLQQLASHRFPLDLLTTHRFGLSEVDYAIRSVGGDGRAGRDPRIGDAVAVAAPAVDRAVLEDLAAASRILVDQGVFDAAGHVSARHPRDAGKFLMPRSLAPALVTADDIIELSADGEPCASTSLGAGDHPPFIERHLHAAIYRRRPDVMAIAHGHSAAVIPFGLVNTPMLATYHNAAFLAAGVPVFDIRDRFGDTDIVISSAARGDAMAEALADKAVVLLRAHGFVAVGPTIQAAVFRAIFTEVSARVQLQAAALGGAIAALDEEEGRKADAINLATIGRSWELWKKRVM